MAQQPPQPEPDDLPRNPHRYMHPARVKPPGFDRFLTLEELAAVPLEELEAARLRAEAELRDAGQSKPAP